MIKHNKMYIKCPTTGKKILVDKPENVIMLHDKAFDYNNEGRIDDKRFFAIYDNYTMTVDSWSGPDFGSNKPVDVPKKNFWDKLVPDFTEVKKV